MKKSIILLACFTLLLAACKGEEKYVWKGCCLMCGNATIGNVTVCASDGITYKQQISKLDKGIFRINWTFTAEEDVCDARIEVDFRHCSKASWWMIPSVSYDGNHWGQGLEPKDASTNGLWHTYSYRRTPIPGAVYSEGGNYAVATWSDVPECAAQDFSCGIMPEPESVTHRIIWPEEEMPFTYCSRDKYSAGWKRSTNLSKGDEVRIAQYVSVCPVEPGHTARRQFLDWCWNNMEHRQFDVPSDDDVWQLGIRYFKESLWAEEGVFRGFNIGLLPEGNGGWYKRQGRRYESGWCGQNISLGCSFLQDYLDSGNMESFEKGMAVLDCWADNCRLPNGLFLPIFDQILDGTDFRIDACNLGTTALNYFKAYELAAACGADRPNYRELAFAICDFVMSDQQADGCYAKGWTTEGECIYREGTVGCFMVPAMLEAYRVSGNEDYYRSAVKAYSFYVAELRENGFTTAGALDTWCIDKESAISLLRSSISLYKQTGSQEYLNDALQTSYYLSTWLWHYDGIYPEDDAFTQGGYHTFGATSVSVQHHHLDYYAVLWVPEWIELSRLTGDRQWKEKADAIWANCCQMISDGTLVVNGCLRPAGAQNEAYYEAYWGFGVDAPTSDAAVAAALPAVEAPPVSRPDRINNWLVAWPGAFRLETLRKIKE